MPTIIRIRDLTRETGDLTGSRIPIDKTSYVSAAKYADISDIVSYIQTGVAAYINPDPVPETIGGIEAGDTFPSPGKSMQEMWDLLLYPYQYPVFTSFSLTHGSPVEIGYDINSGTFSWAISPTENLSGNSISISGYNLLTISNLNGYTGTQSATFSSTVTRTAIDGVGTRAWAISAKNSKNQTISDTYSKRWDWKWYWGTGTTTSIDETQIKALNSGTLYSSYSRTYTFAAGGYKYLCFAAEYGSPSNYIDFDTNFQVAMCGDFPNTDENGFTYDEVSVTNSYSENTIYKVYRTQNIIGDSIRITVS